MIFVRIHLLLLSMLSVRVGGWQIDYYQNRYPEWNPGFWAITLCFWENGDYGNPYWVDQICGGCKCNLDSKIVENCIGPEVRLKLNPITTLKPGIFKESVISVESNLIPNLKVIEKDTFLNTSNLVRLILYTSKLTEIPDLSKTYMTWLVIVQAPIKMNTTNYNGWKLPKSTFIVVLAHLQLHWIPPGWFDFQSLTYLTLAYNKFTQFPEQMFGPGSTSMKYLGMEYNNMKKISKQNLAGLTHSKNFIHLNISNNKIDFIEPGAFGQLKYMIILELQGNRLSVIPQGLFWNIPRLKHLDNSFCLELYYIDLHRNRLQYITSKSFMNLPNLVELRLHSQNPPMQTIAFDAWHGIGQNLVYLFISDNQLGTFPHAAMCGDIYPKLSTIFTDNNWIKNITEFGKEAYKTSEQWLQAKHEKTCTPFGTYPKLLTLNLQYNKIEYLLDNELCALKKLEYLNLYQNNLSASRVSSRALRCLPSLIHLDVGRNKFEEIPVAFRSWPSLKELFMNENPLTFITTGTFTNVTSLIYVKFDNCYIAVIENDAFPPSIVKISLYQNEFRFTHRNPFSKLQMLQVLDLGANGIDILPDNAFEECFALNTLYLDQNELLQLKAVHFQNCPLSNLLLVAGNKIGWIEDGIFSRSSKLGTLDFSNNELNALPVGSFWNKKIGSLIFVNNAIVSIRSETFRNVTFKGVINIAMNRIAVIESFAFDCINGSVELNLTSNPLRKISPYAFNSSTFSHVEICSNGQLRELPSNAFSDVTIGYLGLEGTGLRKMNRNTFYNVQLEVLNLSSNLITKIDEEIISSESSVQSLVLSYNQISSFGDNVFSNITVGSINIQHNQLIVYPVALTRSSVSSVNVGENNITFLVSSMFEKGHSLHLQILYMTNLPIKVINNGTFKYLQNLTVLSFYGSSVEELQPMAFDGLASLEELYLGSTLLEVIPEKIFQPIENLMILSMLDTPLSRLPRAVFDGLSNLTLVNMTGSEITHIPFLGSVTSDSLVIDLSYNKIETISSDAFVNVSNLKTLYLNGNPLECECETVTVILAHKVKGAVCKYPLVISGTMFDIYNASTASFDVSPFDYYQYVHPSFIYCNGENLTAVAASINELIVTWEKPENIYISNSVWNFIPGANKLTSAPVTSFTAALSTIGFSQSSTTLDFSVTMPTVPVTFCLNVTASENNCSTNVTPNSADFAVNVTTEMVTNIMVTGPVLSDRVYIVTCISKTATSLSQKIYASASDAFFNITFDKLDGVKDGTEYECFLQMERDKYTSARGVPVYVSTPPLLIDSIQVILNNTDNSTKLNLNITFYDFHTGTEEFGGMFKMLLSSPTYVLSPYSSWLSFADDQSSNMYSYWFRPVSGTDIEIKMAMTLDHISSSTYRFWSDVFYPIDGIGYTDDIQPDCAGNYHNFGFTGALRTGIKFQGKEKIAVGRGDGLWLFINKQLVVEIQKSNSNATVCHMIDLSPAANKGGGSISSAVGVVINGSCVDLSPISRPVYMELEKNCIYRFDLFIAETTLCSSSLLLMLENTELAEGDTPIDYIVSIPENSPVGSVLETIYIGNGLSMGESYEVYILEGNEARHFTLMENTGQNREVQLQNETTPFYKTVQGTNITYIECVEPIVQVPEPNITDPENFTFSDIAVLLTLATNLDREVMDVYTITLEVKDTFSSLPGQIIVRIRVLDFNDNCPKANQTVFKLFPRPVLGIVPLVTMSVTDADVDMNAKIFYTVSEITYSSPLEYDTGLDIWRDVYTNFTTISFEVVAMDSGSPRLGTPIYFNLTLDNSCLVDVEFGKIAIQLIPDNDTGELFLRIPKYWVHTYDCKDYLGISNGFVRFDQLYTSSDYLPETSAVYGRLNYTGDSVLSHSGGWVAGSNDKNQYFEVRMDEPFKFTQIHLQGRSDEPEWITSFNVTYTDGVSGVWVPYSNDYGESIFLGNIDQTSIVTIDLQPPILGKRIRIHPNTWSGGIALRLELSGCSQTVQKFYDTTCVRCYTSYYCEGDGSMKPCGRCDPAQENGTCDRSPTEHSFGASSECRACPKGWLCKNGYAKICPIYHYITCNDTYCPDTCIPCEAGSVCQDGIKYTCPVGTYSDGKLMYCPACPDGFYQDMPGQGSCKPCPKGHFVSPMHDRCDRCKDINLYTAEDGNRCITCNNSTECPCMITDKCFHRTTCYNLGNGTYECDNCPVGYEGDGVNCQDIDECHLYSPCWNSSACINTNPGYQCLACPHGFTGTFEDALGWNITQRVFELHNQNLAPLQKQVCSDVDECATNNGGCYPLKQCINTIGSFYCGNCISSNIWNNYIGCVPDDLCDAGMQKCDVNAECIYLNPGKYKCECRPGYAGNGMVCGLDSDNDGHPDDHLSCQEWGCRKDNCKLVPNSNQGNYDLDDLGDECDLDKDNDGILDSLVCPLGKIVCTYANKTGCNAYLLQFFLEPSRVWIPQNIAHQYPRDHRRCYKEIPNDLPEYLEEYNCATSFFADDITLYKTRTALCKKDNCIFETRKDQTDSDGDKVGDVCDNCIYSYNPYQKNTDIDSMGDTCDSDIDNDGIPNRFDNCPHIPNSGQSDLDSDWIGDACDNCLSTYNNDQTDINRNGVGDICEHGGDSDGDSIIDSLDNCPFFANADQSDVDGDGQGDECDGDRDGDGIINEMDNCQYIKNVLQTDLNGDTVGDDCEDDSDGDRVLDTNDTCRYNPHISKTSFIKYFTVDLDPSSSQKPVWKVKGNGGEVKQVSKESPMPALLIGEQTYGAIKYSGTWFVKEKDAEDFIGLVFGYVSNQRFYLVMWKRKTSNIGYSCLITGIRGLAIKVVDVPFSPSPFYTKYLYDTFETSSYLWLDPNMEPWEPGLSYRWHLIHKPSLGYIRLTVYRGNKLMTDSGAIYDSTITGGRVGVFQQGTFSTLWSYLQVECLEHTDMALYFDGKDDSVTLGSLSDLKITGSFTFEAWVKLDSMGPLSNNPILCTMERDICLSADSQNITATYGNGNAILSVPNILTVNEWHSIVLKYDDEDLVLDLFINGSYQGSTSLLHEGLEGRSISDRLVIYLGRDNDYFLKGTLDDVRIYGIAVPSTKILDHIKLRSLHVQMLQMYANVEFKMEEQKNTNILCNTGILNITAELSGNPEFVECHHDAKQFQLIHPSQ